MRFRFDGVDRQTGKDIRVDIEADTREDAKARAMRGMVISSVEELPAPPPKRERVMPPMQETVDRRSAYEAPACPGCGAKVRPVKKPKGSMAALILLLMLAVLPGLIYLVIYNGYIFACPVCGMKRGDAT